MTLIDPHDPARYISTYAIVMTPAERALREALRPLAGRGDDGRWAALRPAEAARIATRLRAAMDAARQFDGAEVQDA